MIVSWSAGSLASKTETIHPHLQLLQNFGMGDIASFLRCWWLRWYGPVQRATSCIKCITKFPISGTRKQGGPGRHGLNARRLMSISVAWLELTHKAEMHGEQVFDKTWCWQHHTLKMDMDGWTNGQPIRWRCLAHYLQGKCQRSMSHGSFKAFLSCALFGSVPISRIRFIYMAQINSKIDTHRFQFNRTKRQDCTNRSYLK